MQKFCLLALFLSNMKNRIINQLFMKRSEILTRSFFIVCKKKTQKTPQNKQKQNTLGSYVMCYIQLVHQLFINPHLKVVRGHIFFCNWDVFPQQKH